MEQRHRRAAGSAARLQLLQVHQQQRQLRQRRLHFEHRRLDHARQFFRVEFRERKPRSRHAEGRRTPFPGVRFVAVRASASVPRGSTRPISRRRRRHVQTGTGQSARRRSGRSSGRRPRRVRWRRRRIRLRSVTLFSDHLIPQLHRLPTIIELHVSVWSATIFGSRQFVILGK